MRKLKFVKSKLKVWNKVMFRDLEEKRTRFFKALLRWTQLSTNKFDCRSLNTKSLKEVRPRGYFVKGRDSLEEKILGEVDKKKVITTLNSFIEWTMGGETGNS